MNAPRRFVIPNPLPSTLSFRIRFSGANIRGPAHCHSESASAVPYTRPCTLSFRIRFSGEESAFPASRFQETRRAPCLATLSTWDSRSDRNGFVSGYAFRRTATDAPCRPAPIGRNCHRTLIRCASHQGPPAHDEGAFKSSSTFRASNFGDMLTPAFLNRRAVSEVATP